MSEVVVIYSAAIIAENEFEKQFFEYFIDDIERCITKLTQAYYFLFYREEERRTRKSKLNKRNYFNVRSKRVFIRLRRCFDYFGRTVAKKLKSKKLANGKR